MTKRRKVSDPEWEPLVQVEAIPNPDAEFIANAAGIDLPSEMWQNHIYTVVVGRAEIEKDSGSVQFVNSLSIRRNDRDWPRDWRHFQLIKNQLAGEDVEALELYPRQDRVVDTANQFYLWCLPPGHVISLFNGRPAGFVFGLRLDEDAAPISGAVQRPFSEADGPGIPWQDMADRLGIVTGETDG